MKNIFKVLIINLIVCAGFIPTMAQPLSKVWDKRFGGAGFDDMHSMVVTADGGFLLGGTSDSDADGDRSQASQGGPDYWVVKIDGSGNKVWDKRFGGTEYEVMTCMIATADGNFLLGGYSGSDANGDKSEASQGSSDYWIVKIDGNGNKLWDKRYGGPSGDEMNSMLATADGGFLLGGHSYSGIGGDKSETSQGGTDYWVVKIDGNGNKAWDKRFGGASFDFSLCLITTSDGGFLLGGYSESGATGDKSEASQGGADYWVVKINGSGIKVWDKRFGGDGNEYLYSIVATTGDGFLLGGPSSSGATGDKSQASQGNTDCWVVKINSNGNKVWDKRFGGTGSDMMYSMINTSDGGFLLGASSNSDANGDKSEDSWGAGDYWSVKIDENGNKVWDKRFGGAADDIMYSIIATSDGGFLLGGYSFSNADGDKSQNAQGQFDYWVVKMGNACTPPTASISTSAAIICNGTSTTINFTGTPGAVVTYYSLPNGSGNQTVTLSLLDGTASISTGNLIANETYYLVSVANPDNPTCSQTLTGSTQVMVRGVPYATISGSTTICSGTSTNITFGGLGNSIITYQLNGGENQTITLSNPGSPDWTNSISTGNLTEPATYTVISAELPGNPSCLTDITGKSATVSISGSPTISLSNSQACAGQALTLTATAGFDSYSWSSSGGSFTSMTNEATFSSVTAGGYSFTVTVTLTSGCSATCTTSITVNESTTVNIAGSTLIACSGQEVNLTATIGFSSYSWGSSGGTFTSTTHQATFSSPTAGSYQFTITVTASDGCVGTATSSVFVRGVPSASISNNSVICEGTGNTITFSSSSTDALSGVFVNYRINGGTPQALTLTNGVGSIETGNLTSTTVYELFRVGYSGSVTCPTNITGQSATVTVRPNPTATITGTTSVCSGTSTSLTITATPETRVNYTVNGGAWQQIEIGSTGVGILPTGNLTTTAIYNLTRVGYAASATCPVNITGQSATVTVTTSASTLVGATQYCTGETINLSVVTGCGTPSTYSWSGPNGFTSRASTINIENARTTRSGVYQVQVVFPSGTILLSVSVIVQPTPDIKLKNNPAVCVGQNITLTFTKIPLVSTVIWQGPVGFNSNSISPMLESVTTANEGTYSVTVTEGSCTASATTFVKVNPTLSISAEGNSPLCEGGTIQLSAISSATTGFSWRGPRAFSAVVKNPTLSNARTYNSGVYSVTLTATGFCSATATTEVIVVSIPVVTITTSSGKTILCSGSSLELSASTTDPYAIQWFRNNVSIPGAVAQTIAITSSGTYRAEITNAARCVGSNVVSITSTAPPAVTATNTVTGTTIKLTANPTGLRYSWSGPVAFTSTVRNPSITNATVANAGVYTLQGLMVSSGCTATASTSVVVGSPASRLTANAIEQEATDWLIKTYPNPTNHMLIVEVVLPEASAVQFSLMDITGREKAAWRQDEVTTNHRLEIDMSAYNEGLWLLQAQHKTGSKTKKIWKIK